MTTKYDHVRNAPDDPVETHRTCTRCKRTKLIDAFGPNRRCRGGKSRRCRVCEAARQRRWTRANPGRWKGRDPLYFREKKLRRTYGLSLADYEQMLLSQGGVCAICGRPEQREMYNKPRRLAVDHNHKTGRVRGLLCAACNGRLGALENTEWRSAAEAYLKRHE